MAQIPVFDPNEYQSEAGGDYPMIPAGEYVIQMIESEYGPNRKNNGNDISCVFEIYEGPLKGRRLFHDFPYDHENETRQRIGREDLAKFAEATGHQGKVTETTALHWKPVYAVVEAYPAGSREKDYTFTKDTNKIKAKSYKALPQVVYGGGAQSSAPPAPWLNKAA